MSRPSTSISTTLRRRGLTEEAATAAVDQACRRLRLPTIRAVVADAASSAHKDQLSYYGFLAELLLSECDDRDLWCDESGEPGFLAKSGWQNSISMPTQHQRRHHRHPRHGRLDPQRPTPVLDR